MATETGVPTDMIQSIKTGERPDFSDARDAAVHDLAYELHRIHHIDDATYQRAVDAFGEHGVAELINLCGFYTMVSMSLNTFKIGVPDGEKLPFDALTIAEAFRTIATTGIETSIVEYLLYIGTYK